MKVYVNYPQPHFTIHCDPNCKEFRKHKKKEQRRIVVNQDNLGNVLTDLIQNRFHFRAEKSHNDLWLEVSLDTPEQEIGFVHTIQALLGKKYKPLENARIIKHC